MHLNFPWRKTASLIAFFLSLSLTRLFMNGRRSQLHMIKSKHDFLPGHPGSSQVNGPPWAIAVLLTNTYSLVARRSLINWPPKDTLLWLPSTPHLPDPIFLLRSPTSSTLFPRLLIKSISFFTLSHRARISSLLDLHSCSPYQLMIQIAGFT